MSQHQGEHHASEVHVSPNSTYVSVFLALIVLTVITGWVAFYDFGFLNDIVALGIAFTKASLVVLFFMHVKYGSRLNKMLVIASLVWLSLLLGMTMIDYASRNVVDKYPPGVVGPYDGFEASQVEKELNAAGAEHGEPAHGPGAAADH